MSWADRAAGRLWRPVGAHVAPALGRVRASLGSPPPFDIALSALLMVLTVDATATYSGGDSTAVRCAALAVGLAQAAAMLWRRSHAVLVLAAISASMPVQYLLGLDAYDYTWFIMVYSLFAYRLRNIAVPAFTSALAVIPVCAVARTVFQGRVWWPHLGE